MKHYLVFMKEYYISDTVAFLPGHEDEADEAAVHGPVLILDTDAESVTEIRERLAKLYPGWPADVFDVYEVDGMRRAESV